MEHTTRTGPPNGHPRWGGRKKRKVAEARALADQLQVDPLHFMLKIISSEIIEQKVIAEDGTETLVKVAVSLDTRLDAAKTVMNYLYPRLSAQQISGKDEGPVQVARADFDITSIMNNPELCAAAQSLSLMLTEQEYVNNGELVPGNHAGDDASGHAPIQP